jgi:hypothetical protein
MYNCAVVGCHKNKSQVLPLAPTFSVMSLKLLQLIINSDITKYTGSYVQSVQWRIFDRFLEVLQMHKIPG